jgi:hypothetical protein
MGKLKWHKSGTHVWFGHGGNLSYALKLTDTYTGARWRAFRGSHFDGGYFASAARLWDAKRLAEADATLQAAALVMERRREALHKLASD